MNILFLTISRITSVEHRGIYTDLMRTFSDKGHKVYIVSPSERMYNKPTEVLKNKQVSILKVKTLNLQKTSFIEKGIGTMLLNSLYKKAINKYFSGVKFDLILYSTPPITLNGIIAKLKKRDGAKTYLLLKDIFPQNAVDIALMKENGLLHKFFRIKEKKLYKLSDVIGCMSPANVAYLKKHHPALEHTALIEENPNSIEPLTIKRDPAAITKIRQKHNIPLDRVVFIYGGNLGKPQGVDFMLQAIEACKSVSKAYFLVIGSGTEYNTIQHWFDTQKPKHAQLLEGLPKTEYDNLLKACDVGMIFLDKRFTIPNYPSRLLSYQENAMPIIAATDRNTDIGTIAEKNGYGYWSESGDVEHFKNNVVRLCINDSLIKMGNQGRDFMLGNYCVSRSYDSIVSHFNIVK